jgi:hypothetical protein
VDDVSGNDWQTPDTILLPVRSMGEFVDPCSVATNPTGAAAILTRDHTPCGLTADWTEFAADRLVYANIPYGRKIVDQWAGKIVREAGLGCEIVALTRGDTSTQWFRLLNSRAKLVCFPKRLTFRGAKSSANFNNAIFYFGPRPTTFTHAFHDLGPIVTPITRRQK